MSVDILQRGVQWKQGVVVYIMPYILIYYIILPPFTARPPTAPPSAEYPECLPSWWSGPLCMCLTAPP